MYIIIETNDSSDPMSYGTFDYWHQAQEKLDDLKSKMTEWDYKSETQYTISKLR
jgi:hypothetical protein